MITRADVTVIVLAIATLIVLYSEIWGGTGPAETVHIRSTQGEDLALPLAVNRTVSVRGPLGVSTVEIRDGRVRFVDSPCHGKQCIHTGWLAHTGDVAACLPNGITVQVAGRNPRFDAINF